MVDKIKSRQHEILTLLLENKAGLSIDEIATALDISRNAVQQHFATLQKNGYIQTGGFHKTSGRPVRSFILTEAGINSFPKQYAWFSELLLTNLKEEMGAEALQRYLHKLGANLSQSLLPQFVGKQADEKLDGLLKIMDQLGFQAKAIKDPDSNGQVIEACNCVYHDLAQKHEEVCEFDRTLISSLLESEIEHVECMAKGGAVCRFKIINRGEHHD
ncbi:MAG: HTH domain-containing protein [Methylovulum miyakonense]|uniref:helix-turn-helix transcriptional regulator n=1 Tax=Methylovulum miyakonense TaxID=645578 RepID=UPI003BB5FFB0